MSHIELQLQKERLEDDTLKSEVMSFRHFFLCCLCPKDTAFVGTPIYLAGAQIRRYMHTQIRRYMHTCVD